MSEEDFCVEFQSQGLQPSRKEPSHDLSSRKMEMILLSSYFKNEPVCNNFQFTSGGNAGSLAG